MLIFFLGLLLFETIKKRLGVKKEQNMYIYQKLYKRSYYHNIDFTKSLAKILNYFKEENKEFLYPVGAVGMYIILDGKTIYSKT